MTGNILLLLVQDGLTNGFVYALLTLSILLVFLVTRVLWVPAGDMLVLSALTQAVLQQGQIPGTVWMVVGLGLFGAVAETVAAWRRHSWRAWPRTMLVYVAVPVSAGGLTVFLAPLQPPALIQALLVVALITPVGFMVYRLAFRRLADSSGLVLMFVAVAVHYILTGLSFAAFGPEGLRSSSFVPGRVIIGTVRIPYDLVVVAAVSAGFMATLWYTIGHTLWGRALRATAIDRFGARLAGVRTDDAGAIAFTSATLLGAVSGILIGPTAPLYFDSGFLISLKGFVAAVIGGLGSFPLAVGGALSIGIFESVTSFYSSALREPIVFTLLIPMLIWRSVLQKRSGRGA